MKRSSSKLQIKKGSMSHIGTTPYKYRIDVFISYIDNVKNVSEVCVTWERRGKTQATNVVKIKDDKAVVRETLSMESTLFRRNVKDKGRKAPADADQLKFDEKKVKFVLRKGGPDGKAIGKISMNIAEYVRGVTSTVFADLKLSNSSVIVSKIEASMLHVGKKSKTGSTAGSEAYSEMSEANSLDADSLFGEEEEVTEDFEIPVTKTAPKKSEADPAPPSQTARMSPISAASCPSRKNSQISSEPSSPSSARETFQTEAEEDISQDLLKPPSSNSPSSPKAQENELTQSPSLRQKLRNKIKEKTGRKDKEDDAESSAATPAMRKSKTSKNIINDAEVRELRLLVESLKEENGKLRRSKQAAMDEIDALRNDLEACENALEEATQGHSAKNVGSYSEADVASGGAKDRKIAELNAQNQSLLDELEERHEEEVQSNVDGTSLRETIKTLHNKIEDLEVALRREPQFLDVVNELKVTKVSLALANMEKEQAMFALQTLKQDLGVEDSD